MLRHYLTLTCEQLLFHSLRVTVPIVMLPMGVDQAKEKERYFRECARSSRTNFKRKKILNQARQNDSKTAEGFFRDYRRTSDTLFILGSGESLSMLTQAQWDLIKQHDSAGCNFSIIHDFVPNLFFIEGVKPLTRYTCFTEHARKKQDSYSKIPWIVLHEAWLHAGNDIKDMPEPIQPQFHWNIPISFRITNMSKLKKALLKWNRARKSGNTRLFAHGGSIGMMISAALVAGYRNIVLCGVDLKSRHYFWEVDEHYKNQGPENISGQIHETVDPKSIYRKNSIPADQYLALLNELILKPDNIKLYVSNDYSKLSDSFPVYEFKQTNPTSTDQTADQQSNEPA